MLAIVRTESNFDPRALSVCGAQGLMQLMPYIASEFGCRDPYDPRQNLLAGSAYGLPPYGEVDDYLRKVMLRYLSYSLGEG